MGAFRRAYAELGLTGSLVATDIDPLAPALKAVDRYFLVPRIDDPEYVNSLARICRDESIRLIFPLTDPDIPILAEGREQLEASGAALAAVPARAAHIVHDKWLTYRFLRAAGLPAPRSWKSPPANPEFPLFVKPRVGSAGRGGQKIHNRSELRLALRRTPGSLVQEYLSGPEVTSDVSCGMDGRVWAVVSRQRIEVRWGEVAKGVTIRNDEILAGCVRIARELRARGPITVQCIVQDGRPYFTEINARFGGGLPLGIAAGVPSPRWYLAEAAGIPVEPPELGTYQAGLYLTRYDESYFLSEAEYGEVARHRL
jgi:carbamoyl-phosphate synthase large subunit